MYTLARNCWDDTVVDDSFIRLDKALGEICELPMIAHSWYNRKNQEGYTMIGLIVTGHGTFASGLYSAVKLLAGKPEHFEVVDYVQEDTTDDLSDKLKEKAEILKDCTDGIVIFADIESGAPFREAMELSNDLKGTCRIEVIGGVNLGMVMETNISRSYLKDIDAFIDMAMEEGRKQIQHGAHEE